MLDKTRTGNVGLCETRRWSSRSQRKNQVARKSAEIKVSEQCRTLPRPSRTSKTRDRVTQEAREVRTLGRAIAEGIRAGRLVGMAEIVAYARGWR